MQYFRTGSNPSHNYRRLGVALLAALCTACGPEQSPSSGTTDDTNDTDTNEPSDSTEEAVAPTVDAPQCEIPTFEDTAQPLPFSRLRATIFDEEGDPIPDLLAQACGTNVCLNAKTDAKGLATITETTQIAKLAFKYGDGLQYAHIAVLLPEGEVDYYLEDLVTLRLPSIDPSNQIEPGAFLTSSSADLQLEADTDVKIDVLSYPDKEDHGFVARIFDQGLQPESIATQNFAAVWVLGPQKTKFCPAVKFTVPNTPGLAAGTKLELYLLVTSVEGEFAPYAEWGKVANATVTADGTHIETDQDSGLPELGIIGFRVVE